MIQIIVHYSLHFLFPGLIARTFFTDKWKSVWTIMVLTMLVDVDHLLASPIFDPNRCSIGFHPLHSSTAIFFYFIMLFIPRLRVIALGLLFHMLTDSIDCFWMKWG